MLEQLVGKDADAESTGGYGSLAHCAHAPVEPKSSSATALMTIGVYVRILSCISDAASYRSQVRRRAVTGAADGLS